MLGPDRSVRGPDFASKIHLGPEFGLNFETDEKSGPGQKSSFSLVENGFDDFQFGPVRILNFSIFESGPKNRPDTNFWAKVDVPEHIRGQT